MKKQELIFVYNANSDLFSTVSDFAHKILSPATYSCNLCVLTYGNFAVKQEWKTFIENLSVTTIFLHKDEFEKLYSMKPSLPAIFIHDDGAITEIISRSEIEGCTSLQELKQIVKHKIEGHVQHHHTNL